MGKKQIYIHVEIADKRYRVSIDAHDEEIVRRAALRLRNELKTLHKKFDTSYGDYLAMAALNVSIENEKNIEKLKFSTERLQIEEITRELDQILPPKE